MADASDLDAALCALLASDAALAAILPDGVYFDVAAPGSQKFVLVSQLIHEDVDQFGERAWEAFTYLVKAVTLGTSGSDVKAAALRIDQLLHDAAGTLTAAGYHTMRVRRIERFRFTEVDEVSDSRWQHRGGDYEVWVQPIAAPK